MLKEITVASALAALFVLSGCGDSGSPGGGNPPDTGIEIPSELKQKADVNASMAGRIYHKLYQNMHSGSSVSSTTSNSKLVFSNLLNNKTALKPADLGGDDEEESETKTFNCSNAGGTYTLKREFSETTEDGMNIKTAVIDCSANNCEMNRDDYDDNRTYLRYCTPQEDLEVDSINPQMANYTVTYNGSIKTIEKDAESADHDVNPLKLTSEQILESKNMSMIFHIIDSDLEEYKFSNGKISYKEEYTETDTSEKFKVNIKSDYTYKSLERKVSNHAQIVRGSIAKSILDIEWTEEEDDSKSKEYGSADGYYIGYEVSGSESNKTLHPDSFAYDNYTWEKVAEGDKSEYNLNGGINDSLTCNSMYYITTDNIVKHNKTYHVSGDGRNDILPYEGKATLESNGKAVATFNVDEDNKTSMRLEIDDELVDTYGKWSEVPNYDCDEE